MLRTQVQLTEKQDLRLTELGRERRVSKAELVRQAVDLFLARETVGRSPEEQRRMALEVAGRFHSGNHDTARRHGGALAEAFAKTGEAG